MVRAGDVIENPAMGARIEFVTVAEDSGGSLLEFDFFLRPGGVVATEHLHPQQEERFEVIAGLMSGHAGGREQTLGPGAASVVAAGVPHAWRNAGDGEAHLRVQFRPALDTEELFATVFALGAQGRTDSCGVPVFPLRLTLLAAFPREVRPSAMPALAHRLVIRAFAPSGRRLRRRHAAGAMSINRRTSGLPPEIGPRHGPHPPPFTNPAPGPPTGGAPDPAQRSQLEVRRRGRGRRAPQATTQA